MKTQSILIKGREVRLLTCHTAVVGSRGCGLRRRQPAV